MILTSEGVLISMGWKGIPVSIHFKINYATVIIMKPNNQTIKRYHLIPKDQDKHMHLLKLASNKCIANISCTCVCTSWKSH